MLQMLVIVRHYWVKLATLYIVLTNSVVWVDCKEEQQISDVPINNY